MAATLTLRSVKGAPLTNNEVDANFTNLNSEISDLESDMLTAEGNITTLQTDLNTAEGNITTLQSDVSALQTATGANLPETIADVVGTMVSSNTESGISVVYQDSDNTLDFDVNDFTITVNGDATGSATISNLGNATLTLDVSSITGNLTVTGDVQAANFNTTSDIALKENLNIIDSPLAKIEQLNGYTFNWKENKKEAIGIVAQEVEKVFPELVVTGADGVKRVNYDSLIPVMLEAIKELAKR
jgi:hypothetical protein